MRELLEQVLRATKAPRLSGKEAIVLAALVGKPDGMYGLELVEVSRGGLKRGSVYVVLGRMEGKGYVSSREEPRAAGAKGPPLRIYSPTADGLKLFEEWRASTLPSRVPTGGDPQTPATGVPSEVKP